MLKRFILCLLLSALAVREQAQAFLGIRIAANRTTFYGDHVRLSGRQGDTTHQTKPLSLLGGMFGLFGILPLKGRWLSLQPEVNLGQTRAGTELRVEDPSIIHTQQHIYSFSTVQVPILLRISAGSRRLRVFGLAGPYASYAWSGRHRMVIDRVGKNSAQNQHDEIPAKVRFREDSIHRVDAGLVFGAGATARFGPIWFGFDFRYQRGLRDVFYSTRYDPPNTRLKSFAPSLFLMIPINKE